MAYMNAQTNTEKIKSEKIKNSTENIKKSFGELKWYENLMGAIMIFIAVRAMILAFTQGEADGNPAWLTVINFISAVCGVICIFFTAKANISNFIFATVNTIVYAIYLVYWHIWGTAALEIFFYIPMNFILSSRLNTCKFI